MDTGKYVAGALVRKRRNASLFAAAASASPNTIFSNAGIHDFASLAGIPRGDVVRLGLRI